MPRPSANDITQETLPKISHGRGVYLWDAAGRQYIDGSGGPAVFSIGHGDPRVNEAVAKQMEKVAYGYRYLFTTDPLEEMSEIICQATGLVDMVYTTSGSEAVESAVKIALQYHFDREEPERVKFIARKRSWHGNTLMATALSGFEDRQRAFAGALPAVGRVSAANAYRLPEGVTQAGLVAHLAAELEAEILRLGPETVAGFIFEPVVGAAGGALPAPEGYAKAVAEVCHSSPGVEQRPEVAAARLRLTVAQQSAVDIIIPRTGTRGMLRGTGERFGGGQAYLYTAGGGSLGQSFRPYRYNSVSLAMEDDPTTSLGFGRGTAIISEGHVVIGTGDTTIASNKLYNFRQRGAGYAPLAVGDLLVPEELPTSKSGSAVAIDGDTAVIAEIGRAHV